MNRLSPTFLVCIAFTGAVCVAQEPINNDGHNVLTVVGMPPSALSIYSDKEVRVQYGNKFRFDIGPQTTQAPIGSAALPGSLGLSSTAISALPTALAEQSIQEQPADNVPPELHHITTGPTQTPVIPDYPEACDMSDRVNVWPSNLSSQKARITKCWNGILKGVGAEKKEVSELGIEVNEAIRNAAREQRCYTTNLWNFRQPILTQGQATNLVAFAVANVIPGDPAGCHLSGADAWPLADADQSGISLLDYQQQLTNLTTAPGYSAWSSDPGVQSSNVALVKSITDLIALVNAYSTGTVMTGAGNSVAQTYSDFQTVVANNQQWRKQLSNISNFGAGALASLEIDIPIEPCHEWYGKGRTDAIKIHTVDLSTSAGTAQDIALATNTCNPRTIISTGVGISFLPSPTYAFVPADNTGSQVIGETASNNESPLYAVFYNVQLHSFKHGVELFASSGVGLTSSSSTSNSDFLGGLSLSFARRVIFLTPAVDIGRRDQLTPGFSIGTPKGSLSSVPIQSHWPVRFMLSISFGIGPS